MTNPTDLQMYGTLLSIAGGLISLLLGIVIWATQRLVKNIGLMADKVSHLSEKVGGLETTISERNLSCKAKHSIIDHRLNSHGDDLKRQSTDIAVIKSKLKL